MDENHKKKSLIDYLGSAQRGWGFASFGFKTIGAATTGVFITISVAVFLILMSTPGLSATGENPISSSPMPIENLGDFVAASGASDSELQTITDALSLGLSFPLYKSLLTSAGPIKVSFQKDLTRSGKIVDGVTDQGEITMRSGMNLNTLEYAFLHETGHIIIFRNSGLFNSSYPYNTLIDVSSPDFPCYRNGFLKTYPVMDVDVAGTARVESFAESVSKFLIRESPYRKGELTDFPNQCKNTYGWFKENVFVGPSK